MPLQSVNERVTKSIHLGAAHEVVVCEPVNINANQVLGSVQGAYPLNNESKVLRVSATAAGISGAPVLQISVGPGASGAVGLTDTLATLGVSVFTAPITLTCNNYAGQTISPANIDVLYPSGAVLTTRVQTGAGDTATGLKVAMEFAPICENPGDTQPFGTSSF